jgi:hypothetical protein
MMTAPTSQGTISSSPGPMIANRTPPPRIPTGVPLIRATIGPLGGLRGAARSLTAAAVW